jgi:hypothetical protein
VAIPQDDSASQHPDALAAVVLHTLVTQAFHGMTREQIARACERDPLDPLELRETVVALQILLDDDLASRDGDLFKPTRAAIRAAELSF